MLEIQKLTVSYGAIRALQAIDLRVDAGSIVTLIGANGAGKSTVLRTISGLVQAESGQIIFQGQPITKLSPHCIVARGLAHVPEGRMIFPELTVQENLAMGEYSRSFDAGRKEDRAFVFSIFPRLAERLHQSAGTLSGGEQQMLAIGRALLSGAKFLMLDEPSLGIAPLLVRSIFERLVEINRQRNITMLLVEQNANLALSVSHYAYVMENGAIRLQGSPNDIRDNPLVKEAYLGG